LPALLRDGYPDRFSLGLLTAAGSLSILLPPALPLIVYAVVAEVPVEDLFLGGILPGALMTGLVAAWGIRAGHVHRVPRQPCRPGEARLVGRQVGARTAARRALRAAERVGDGRRVLRWRPSTRVVQVFVHRDEPAPRSLPASSRLRERGRQRHADPRRRGRLTSYLVNAQVPAELLGWTREHVASPSSSCSA
jgi:TRAP-type mannitol/chloroaromatic compound transport system permease large subunit